MDARVARIPYVVLSPHLVKRKISTVKTRDCTHGRCGRRSVTTIDEVEPASHSQHQCERLEKIWMAKIQRQMCLSVPQCNRTAFPCLPFTQNMHQGHRIRAATGRAKIVHYHGLKVSRKREVAKSFCDLGARPEIIVCQAVATKCASVLSL